MPSFDIIKKTNIGKSYRCQCVAGAFDLDNAELDEHFKGDIDIDEQEWSIGLIVGSSGSGKTTIAIDIFGDKIFKEMPHNNNNAVIDDMPIGVGIHEIEKMFCSVGFSSPPNWLRPYNVLSNGEKMRCNIAYSLLSNRDIVVYDEFTSVVDRNVAKICSCAIAKSVRKNNKKFVAISCHSDIIDWLCPDWIYDTDRREFFFVKNSKDQQSRLTFMRFLEEIKNECGIYSGSITI